MTPAPQRVVRHETFRVRHGNNQPVGHRVTASDRGRPQAR